MSWLASCEYSAGVVLFIGLALCPRAWLALRQVKANAIPDDTQTISYGPSSSESRTEMVRVRSAHQCYQRCLLSLPAPFLAHQ